jgi:hypothetical protein
MSEWQPIETAPYETQVLTYWSGSKNHNPVCLINTKNNGRYLGTKDGWWYSRQDQQPDHWMPLPDPPKEKPHE